MRKLLSYTAVGLVLGWGAFAIAQNVSNYMEQGGARWVIGGSLDVASGGDLDIESGASLKIAGTTVAATAAELDVLNGSSLTTAELDDVTLQVHVEDISVATTYFTVSYFAGDVTDWYCVLRAGFAGSNVTLTLNVNGAQPTTNGTLTVTQSGSASGDIDSAAVSGANTIASGQLIAIGSGGSATEVNTVEMCTVVIDR